LFFFNPPPPPATYPLSLHDALPICHRPRHPDPRQTRLVAQTPLRSLPRPRRYHLDVLRRFNRALVPNIVASVLSPIPNELARIDTINRIGNHKNSPLLQSS